jgi:tetratricopeptide (TPR) repeat protein
MAAVFVVGALVGLGIWITMMSAHSPEKTIRGFAEFKTPPPCDAWPPDDSPGAEQYRKGQNHCKEQDWTQAELAFGRAASMDPSLTRARVYQGVALMGQKKLPEAARVLEAAIQEAAPRGQMVDDGYYYLARAYCGMGEGEKASEMVHRCVEEGGAMLEACVKLMKALDNQLLMLPKKKDAGKKGSSRDPETGE